MKVKNILLLLPVCLTLLGGSAFADYIHITYRSGKVQTIRLDEPSSSIASLSYQEDNASPATPAPTAPVKPGIKETTTGVAPSPQKDNGKPPVHFEWAQPLD